MNLCVLAGRIINRPSVKGTDRKILRFTVETRDGNKSGAEVVVFNRSLTFAKE